MENLKFALRVAVIMLRTMAAVPSLTVKLLLWNFTDKSIFIRSALKTMESVQHCYMKLGMLTVDDEMYHVFENLKSQMRFYAY